MQGGRGAGGCHTVFFLSPISFSKAPENTEPCIKGVKGSRAGNILESEAEVTQALAGGKGASE